MNEADAKAQGIRPDHNKPCSWGINLPRRRNMTPTLATARTVTPERIGDYALLRVIASGAMGILYESVDLQTGWQIALKVLHRDLLNAPDTEGFLAKFRGEALVAASLDHPGIVSVYDYGAEAGYAYIAMEYVEGRSLRDCFERKVAFRISDSVDLMSQLLEALQYAHEHGVWHRDIKPANVLISHRGQIKVVDFGIARTEPSASDGPEDVMGTPGYIAPEAYLSDTFDNRVDVFAAGAVLYQLFAGAPAFVGTAEQIMLQACYEEPLPPSMASGRPALRQYDAVVLRALAKSPQERYCSAAEFREALLNAHNAVTNSTS
jgi:serine/threonine protein kinase